MVRKPSTVSAEGSMGGSSSRLATAAAVVLGVGVLAVAGRLLATTPSVHSPPTTAAIRVVTAPPDSITVPTEGVLVPEVIGRTLAQARTVLRNAGLPSGDYERDPQVPNAVVVAQEPPSGAWVPPNSPVGFRTRSDVWPNGTPRRLQLGRGPTTASYRVVVADPMYHQLTVAITMPPTVKLRVWLETTVGRRVAVLDTEDGSGRCRRVNQQSRCQVALDGLHEEAPGVWAVGLAKRSIQPAAIRATVTF
jgi:PASTA domain